MLKFQIHFHVRVTAYHKTAKNVLSVLRHSFLHNRAVFIWVSWNQNQSYHSGQSQSTKTMQWTNQNSKQLHVASKKRGKTCERVAIGFCFPSDWSGKWREIFKPIAKRLSNAKPKQMWITCDTQVKPALKLHKESLKARPSPTP